MYKCFFFRVFFFFVINKTQNTRVTSHKKKKKKMKDKLKKVVRWIKEAKRVYFFTGAGMSAASGISTFRGSHGLWVLGRHILMITICILSIFGVFLYFFAKTSLFKIFLFSFPLCGLSLALPLIAVRMVAFADGWTRFPKINWILFKIIFFDKVVKATLNDGHKFIKYLKEEYGKQVIIVTANVDGLEAQVSSHIEQVHGSIQNIFCSHCQEKQLYQLNMRKSLSWLPPKCESCQKRRVRTGCLLFKDGKNPFFQGCLEFVYNISKKPNPVFYPKKGDVCFVIGTSGIVDFGVRRIPEGANVVEINPTEKTLKEVLYFQNTQEMILRRLHYKFIHDF